MNKVILSLLHNLDNNYTWFNNSKNILNKLKFFIFVI